MMGSERSFGLTFAIVFGRHCDLATDPGRRNPRLWAITASVALLAVTYLRPAVPAALKNIVWFRLGLLLSAVVTPGAMTLLYMTTFVPSLCYDSKEEICWDFGVNEKPSYWIAREMPGPERGTMKRQF